MAKSSTSPTQRTLKRLRQDGAHAEVVERWVPQARKRIDLAGCIDVLAFGREVGILGVQATSATNHAARRTKAMQEPRLRRWLGAGGRFEIWSWAKVAGRWQVRRERINLIDITGPDEGVE